MHSPQQTLDLESACILAWGMELVGAFALWVLDVYIKWFGGQIGVLPFLALGLLLAGVFLSITLTVQLWKAAAKFRIVYGGVTVALPLVILVLMMLTLR